MKGDPGVMARMAHDMERFTTSGEDITGAFQQLSVASAIQPVSEADTDDEQSEIFYTPRSSLDGTEPSKPVRGDSDNFEGPVDIVAHGCEPRNIFALLDHKACTFFNVRFMDCNIGTFNMHSCYLINVEFNNCKFGGANPTSWKDIVLNGMEFINCDFRDFFWSSDKLVASKLNGNVVINESFEAKSLINTTMVSEIANIEWAQEGEGGMSKGEAVASVSTLDSWLLVQLRRSPVTMWRTR